MTPTHKHIEEAQILYNAVGSAQLCSGNVERDVVVQKLATLLAAQEELETLGPRVDKLFEAHKQWTLAVSDERDQLRAELEKWKLGCETNADCYRAAVRAQDEQRLELIKLRSQVSLLNDSSATAHSYLELLGQLSELLASLKAEGETNDTMKKAYESMRCRWKLALTGYSERNEIIERLQTHNAALLTVASRVSEWLKERDEKGYTLRDTFEVPVIQALSALEPLGIKLLP